MSNILLLVNSDSFALDSSSCEILCGSFNNEVSIVPGLPQWLRE